MRKAEGQVTIFISMVMMCVFALFCCLVESARTAGARWYLETAACSAMDSVFSQYHRQLWDSYRLLFAEYEDESELEADFVRFLAPYLETENWYPMAVESAKVEDWVSAVDGSGMYLEQEILDYMQYGVWKMDFDAVTIEGLWDSAREAASVKTVAERYRGHAKEALKLEKSLEAISGSQEKQKQLKEKGLGYLRGYDGPGFCRTAKDLIRELERMPGLVQTYRREADKLAENLRQSRNLFESEKSSCKDSVQGQLDEEIRQYESYIDEDGQRRKEVEALEEMSKEQVHLVEDVIEEALEVERIIDEWEDDDEDDDGPDLEALWSPVRHHFDQLIIRFLSFSHGVKDKEKEGWLNQVERLYQSGMLELVLPPGTAVSKNSIATDELASHRESMAEGARGSSLADHLIVDEYCGRFFRCFRENGEAEKESPDAGEAASAADKQDVGVPGEDGLQYEVEYILGGKDIDESNLVYVVERLLTIREGLNLIHILSDSQKREAARNLAMVITGVAGLSPLVLLTTFFVMSIWALGEALMDVRGLLAGKRVVLLKSAEDWTSGIDELLSMGREGDVMTGGGDRGLTYLSWLKVLLLMEDIVRQEYRMMDMMEMNIRRTQDSFRMRRGVYQVRMHSRLCGKHVFFSLGFVEKLTGGQAHTYPMEISVERKY